MWIALFKLRAPTCLGQNIEKVIAHTFRLIQKNFIKIIKMYLLLHI